MSESFNVLSLVNFVSGVMSLISLRLSSKCISCVRFARGVISSISLLVSINVLSSVNFVSGAMSRIRLCRRVKPLSCVRSANGVIFATSLRSRYNTCKFVAFSKPVRSFMPLFMANRRSNALKSVSKIGSFGFKPSSARTAAAKFLSGISFGFTSEQLRKIVRIRKKG